MTYLRNTAEVLGLQVMGWLIANDDLLPIFLGSTGVSESDIRAGANDAAFLGGVLDFVMMDDAWVVQCCDTIGVARDSLFLARQALPGGEQVNWT